MKREARILVYFCSNRLCAAAVLREYSLDSLFLSPTSTFCYELANWNYIGEVRYIFPERCCNFDFQPVPGENVKMIDTFYRFLANLVEEVERALGETGHGSDVSKVRGDNGTTTH